jgi:hypothetical protein
MLNILTDVTSTDTPLNQHADAVDVSPQVRELTCPTLQLPRALLYGLARFGLGKIEGSCRMAEVPNEPATSDSCI